MELGMTDGLPSVSEQVAGHLARVAPFCRLPLPVLMQVCGEVRKRCFPANTTLVREGSVAGALYVPVSGEWVISTRTHGITAQMTAEEALGLDLAAIFPTVGTSAVSVTLKETSVVLMVPAQVCEDVLHRQLGMLYQQRLAALATTYPALRLCALSAADRQYLLDSFEVVHFQPGECVLASWAAAQNLMLVEHGSVYLSFVPGTPPSGSRSSSRNQSDHEDHDEDDSEAHHMRGLLSAPDHQHAHQLAVAAEIVAELGPGTSLGAAAVMPDPSKDCVVTAATAVSCSVLHNKVLQDLLQQSSATMAAVAIPSAAHDPPTMALA